MKPIYFESQSKAASYLDLQECVLQYQKTKSERVLSLILYKLKGTINSFIYKSQIPDKESILALIEDKFLECLDLYDVNKQSTFYTFFYECVKNAILNFRKRPEIHRLFLQTLSLDFGSGDNKEEKLFLEILSSEDMSYENVDTELYLASIKSKLDENEYRVCKLLIEENHKMTNTEIGVTLGLTPSAIPNIKARLRKKFTKFALV